MRAFVLHTIPYQDRRIIARLLSQESGFISAVFSVGKRRGAKPQLFTPYDIQLSGSGSLKRLQRCEVLEKPVVLREMNLYCGLYLNELLLKFLPEGLLVEGVFDCYQAALKGLSQPGLLLATLRQFEWQLLDTLGQGPNLLFDQDNQPIEADGFYICQPGAAVQRCAKTTERLVYPGSVLIAMATEDWSDEVTLRYAKVLLREWIAYYLEGRPLKSRALIRSMGKG